MLTFCLGLENNREVDASLLEMVHNTHCVIQPIRYRFVEHVFQTMQKKIIMIKRGSSKTFRLTTYLCHLLLIKCHGMFENNKL